MDLDRIVRDANRAVTTYGESSYILFDGDQLIYTSAGIDPETANGFMKQTGQPYSIIHQNGHSYEPKSMEQPPQKAPKHKDYER